MSADFTLIEGAGGWRVPLADQDNLSDLAIALKLPVILVVGVRLGCISHALLTAEAIARDGLQLAGWVANIIDPKTSRLEENLATPRRAVARAVPGAGAEAEAGECRNGGGAFAAGSARLTAVVYRQALCH